VPGAERRTDRRQVSLSSRARPGKCLGQLQVCRDEFEIEEVRKRDVLAVVHRALAGLAQCENSGGVDLVLIPVDHTRPARLIRSSSR